MCTSSYTYEILSLLHMWKPDGLGERKTYHLFFSARLSPSRRLCDLVVGLYLLAPAISSHGGLTSSSTSSFRRLKLGSPVVSDPVFSDPVRAAMLAPPGLGGLGDFNCAFAGLGDLSTDPPAPVVDLVFFFGGAMTILFCEG